MGTGRRPVHGLCAAVDVHYLTSGGARAAAVVAADTTFACLLAELTTVVPEVAPYRPGEFYRRELPPLRAVLDADGYQTPIFSADGRHLAIRGSAYENSLDVFEFPSLGRVLATTLGQPNPGYPYPQEWLEQMRAWSRHNIAFGVQPGVLWIGTPAGALVEVGLDNQHVVKHDVLAGSPVTGLGATATGELVVASGGSDLALVSVLADSAKVHAADSATLQATVTSFLDSTSEVPGDGSLETHLVVTDGARTWQAGDLATMTTATPTDPAWLRLQAAINNASGQRE